LTSIVSDVGSNSAGLPTPQRSTTAGSPHAAVSADLGETGVVGRPSRRRGSASCSAPQTVATCPAGLGGLTVSGPDEPPLQPTARAPTTRNGAQRAASALAQDRNRLEALRDRLESGLQETPDVLIIAGGVPRLPNTTLFTTPGLRAETAVIGFDLEGIAVSSGSACSSGKVQVSHVLQAMGFGPEQATGAVRLSLGWSTTDADIDYCLQAWRKLAGTLVKGERRNPA